MTPEQQARQEVDRQLLACGWQVQNFSEMNLSAGSGIAVREYPLDSGFADYLLYVDGKAIGIVKAKPEGHSLTGVETQSARYAKGLPGHLSHYVLPLPFAYETTGKETRFTNGLDPSPRSRSVFAFHRPEELLALVKLGDQQLRANLRNLPPLNTDGLWKVQVEAIRGLETSLAQGRPRALIQMATGSGKTFTACSFTYRLIKFAKAKRILFLVDRNNPHATFHTPVHADQMHAAFAALGIQWHPGICGYCRSKEISHDKCIRSPLPGTMHERL